MDIAVEGAICSRCGKRYGSYKSAFAVSYGALYKGVGHLTVCRECVGAMYAGYLSTCGDTKTAMRALCRKLDLFWSERVFDAVEGKSTERTLALSYIAKLNTTTYAGKSYDDTLLAEGTLGNCGGAGTEKQRRASDEAEGATEEQREFWGDGYDAAEYRTLDEKLAYYKRSLDGRVDSDFGTERLLRQLCILEYNIDRDSAAGKPVDKSTNTYNTLLGSLNLKPAQKKDDADAAADNTPFGVWIKKWEDKRPVPEPDPEMKDTDGIIKYISVWFLGHLSKMLNLKNGYCKLYEEEIAKRKVERPETSDEDDEDAFNDIFGGEGEDEEAILEEEVENP